MTSTAFKSLNVSQNNIIKAPTMVKKAYSTENENSFESGGATEFGVDLLSKLDELFLQWISQESSQDFLKQNFDKITGSSMFASLFDKQISPTSSPKISKLAPSSPKIKNARFEQTDSISTQLKKTESPNILPPLKATVQKLEFARVADELAKFELQFANESRITKLQFMSSFKQITNLPSFIGSLIFNKISSTTKNKSIISRQQIIDFWNKSMIYERDYCVFNIIKNNDNSSFINFSSMKDLILEVVQLHPSLEILRDSAEFRERYAETVSVRIFFTICKSKKARMSFLQFKAHNFLQTLCEVDSNSDINMDISYFSYEHFYVIYCKFWELDVDHNLLLNQQDLEKYGDRTLSKKIIQKIILQPSFDSQKVQKGFIHYLDFVYFMLAEEDKTTETSIDFWFHCVDFDGDGFISAFELEYFFEEQLSRMKQYELEIVSFRDFFCQCLDMINPAQGNGFTLKDLKKDCRLSANMFNLLFNFRKFLILEREECVKFENEWHRFATIEYQKHVENDQRK